jgi:hypothetical protein
MICHFEDINILYKYQKPIFSFLGASYFKHSQAKVTPGSGATLAKRGLFEK